MNIKPKGRATSAAAAGISVGIYERPRKRYINSVYGAVLYILHTVYMVLHPLGSVISLVQVQISGAEQLWSVHILRRASSQLPPGVQL